MSDWKKSAKRIISNNKTTPTSKQSVTSKGNNVSGDWKTSARAVLDNVGYVSPQKRMEQLNTNDGKPLGRITTKGYQAIQSGQVESYFPVNSEEATTIENYKKYVTEKFEQDKATKITDYVPPANLPTKREYLMRRAANPSLPEFGSFDYFKDIEKKIRKRVEEEKLLDGNSPWSDPRVHQNAAAYQSYLDGGDSAHNTERKKDDYQYIRKISDLLNDYMQVDDQLRKFEYDGGVTVDAFGNVDYEKGKKESEYASSRYNLMHGAFVAFNTVPAMIGEDGTYVYKDNGVVPYEELKWYGPNSLLERKETEAYQYYKNHKDDVYTNDLGGRFAGNYQVGRIGIKKNDADYAAYLAQSDDLEAGDVYQLLSNRIVQNNYDTFVNKNPGEEAFASFAQYAPQGVDQLGIQVQGVIVNGLTGVGGLYSSAAQADYMYRQTAGATYGRMLREYGMPVEDAQKMAHNEAVLSSAVEFGLSAATELVWGAKGLSGTDDVIRSTSTVKKGAFQKALTSIGVSDKGVQIAAKAAKETGKFTVNLLSEGTEEWLQEGLSITADRLAKEGRAVSMYELGMESLDFSKYTSEDYDRMGDAFVNGMIISFGGSVIRSATSKVGTGAKNGMSKTVDKLTIGKLTDAADSASLGKDVLSMDSAEFLNGAIDVVKEKGAATLIKKAETIQTAMESGKEVSATYVGDVVKSAMNIMAEQSTSEQTTTQSTETNETVPAENAINSETEEILSTEMPTVSVGDSFRDTKYGSTVTVVARDNTNTTVEIRNGDKVTTKTYTNEQAARLVLSDQYEQVASVSESHSASDESVSSKTRTPAKTSDWESTDVEWGTPDDHTPIAYSTRETSRQITKAAQNNPSATISDLRNLVSDTAAKKVLQAYVDAGYGNQVASEWFNPSVDRARIFNIGGVADNTVENTVTDTETMTSPHQILDDLGLTYEEKRDILNHKSSSSYMLNYLLYHNESLSPEEQSMIDNINSALDKFAAYEGVVYRSIGFADRKAFDKFIEKYKNDEVIRHEGFTSASKDVDGYPVDMPYTVHYKLLSCNGKDVSAIGLTEESEVLFKTDSSFLVQSFEVKNNEITIVGKELMESDKELRSSVGKTGNKTGSNVSAEQLGDIRERDGNPGKMDSVRERSRGDDELSETESAGNRGIAEKNSISDSMELRQGNRDVSGTSGVLERREVEESPENEKITVGMSDDARAELLNKKSVNVVSVGAEKTKTLVDVDFDSLQKTLTRHAKPVIEKVAKDFGILNKTYFNPDIELDFEYSNGSLKESINKQHTMYGDFVKMLSVFPDVISNAVGIETHTDKYKGTIREDTSLKQMYVLASALSDEKGIIPVKLEVKEFNDKANKLYLSVVLTKKESRYPHGNLGQNQLNTAPPTSTISISDLVSIVNPSEGDFLKYFPDSMLDSEQIEGKNKALSKDAEKIEKLSGDKKRSLVAAENAEKYKKQAAVRESIVDAVTKTIKSEVMANATLMQMLQDKFGGDGLAGLVREISATFDKTGTLGDFQKLFTDDGKIVYQILKSGELNNERRDLLSDDGGKRSYSTSSEKSTKRVGERSNRYLEGRRNSSKRRKYCQALRTAGYLQEKIVYGHKCEVVSREHYNDRMKKIESNNRSNGFDETIFVSGAIVIPFVKDSNGKSRTAKGVFLHKGGKRTAIVQYDNYYYTPEQISDHENVHNDFKSDRVRKIKNIIRNSLSVIERKRILQRLSRDYNGIIKGNEEKIFEEFIANVLSGMDAEYSSVFSELSDAYWKSDDHFIDNYKVSEYNKLIDTGDSKASVLERIGYGNEYRLSESFGDIPYREYMQLCNHIVQKNNIADVLPSTDCKEIGDNFYIWNNTSKTDFTVVGSIPIVGNEDFLNAIRSEITNDTYRGTENFNTRAVGIRSGKRSSTLFSGGSERATTDGNNDRLSVRQPESNTRGHLAESGRDKTDSEVSITDAGGMAASILDDIGFGDENNLTESGDEYDSENTETLEERKTRESNDSIWKRSDDTGEIYQRLGGAEGASRVNLEKRRGFIDWGRRIQSYDFRSSREKERAYGVLRKISKRRISDVDADGRHISSEIMKYFANAVFKNENGELIPLFHATDNEFNVYEQGDFGFHVGTAEQAMARGGKYIKELYANITSPLFIPVDRGIWPGLVVANEALSQGVITQNEYNSISKMEGFHSKDFNSSANISLRKLLQARGYDGILYFNGFEGDGISAIAFDSNQLKYVSNQKPTVSSNLRYALLTAETDAEELTPERKKEILEQFDKDRAGVEKPTQKQLWGERASWIAHNMTRVFPEIPERGERGTFFAEFRKHMIQWKSLPTTASFMTQDKLNQMTKDLSPEEFKTFSELVYFLDLQEEANLQKERGFDEVLLPNNILPHEVDAIVEELNQEASEKVQQALAKRQQIWDTLKEQYISLNRFIGFDTEDRFKRKNYYHHQVIEYMNNGGKGIGSREIGIKVGRGWLKERHGSTKAINTDFLAVEYRAMLQMQYDVYIANMLGKIKKQYDIKPQLEQDAFQNNKKLLNDIIIKESTDKDGNRILDSKGKPDSDTYRQQQWFNQRIMFGFSGLFDLAKEGNLPTFGGQYGKVVQTLSVRELNVPGLYSYVGELANTELTEDATEEMQEAVKWARTVLKYTSQKKAWTKQVLGDNYQTWETLAAEMKETHTIHQPRKGNYFYTKTAVDEDAFQQAFTDMVLRLADGDRGSSTDKSIVELFTQYSETIRQIGAKYEQWVLPNEIVSTMDKVANPKHVNLALKLSRSVVSSWKGWSTSVNPFRTIKFGIRNMVGDLDAVIAGNPGIVKYSKQAVEEIRQAMKKKQYSDTFMEWVERGGYSAMIFANEMDNEMQDKLFSHLKGKEKFSIFKIPATIVKGYRNGVENAHNFREAILRYSAYLYYKNTIQKNGGIVKDNVASNRYIIRGLQSIEDKAYQLSKDLLGAYDEVGMMGQHLRRYWVPFYSFTETNLKRYYRLFENAITSDGTIPKKAGKLLVKGLMVNLLAILMVMWNRTVKKDDDDKLPPSVRNIPHITLGRIGDEVFAFRQLGSFSELLEWAGLEDYQWTEEDWMAPIDKAWGMISPFLKQPIELISGLNFYPSISKPRAIRDRWEHFFSSFGVDSVYRIVVGKPSKGVGDTLRGSVVYTYDYKESAYYEILDIKRKYQGENDNTIYGVDAKSNALYYMKLAIRYKDKQAALKYLDEYFANGGTGNGIVQSFATLDPMYGYTGKDTIEKGEAFIASLSDEEKEKLRIAQEYYETELMLPENVAALLRKKNITDEEAKNLLISFINGQCK